MFESFHGHMDLFDSLLNPFNKILIGVFSFKKQLENIMGRDKVCCKFTIITFYILKKKNLPFPRKLSIARRDIFKVNLFLWWDPFFSTRSSTLFFGGNQLKALRNDVHKLQDFHGAWVDH